MTAPLPHFRRLLALARGQPELSLGLWNEVKALEAQRCARLPP